MKKGRLNLSLDQPTIRRIDALSRRSGHTATQVVEDAVRQHYARMTGGKELEVKTVDVSCKVSELSADGLALLDAARRQSELYRLILSPDGDGNITATLWDNDGLGLDDTIAIRCESVISRADRMREFGVEALGDPRHTTGERSLITGEMIPTEQYIANVVRAYGDTSPGRRWEIPDVIVRDARAGCISGAEAINRAGAELREFCANGKFTIAG